MTTKIQKQFFEKYNIPKRFYTIVNLGDLDYNYQEVSADTLEELFDNVQMYLEEWVEDVKYFKDYEEKYPEITDSIYLKLIKIIIKNYGNFSIDSFSIDSIYYNNHKEYEACTDSEWGTYNICGEYQKSEEDAILSLFVNIKNKKLNKQVQDLFKH